ncbi:MAG: hypothetical protein ACPGJV_09395 [Bacteriovoracaceae bacterium]
MNRVFASLFLFFVPLILFSLFGPEVENGRSPSQVVNENCLIKIHGGIGLRNLRTFGEIKEGTTNKATVYIHGINKGFEEFKEAHNSLRPSDTAIFVDYRKEMELLYEIGKGKDQDQIEKVLNDIVNKILDGFSVIGDDVDIIEVESYSMGGPLADLVISRLPKDLKSKVKILVQRSPAYGTHKIIKRTVTMGIEEAISKSAIIETISDMATKEFDHSVKTFIYSSKNEKLVGMDYIEERARKTNSEVVILEADKKIMHDDLIEYSLNDPNYQKNVLGR